jgi:hypothetical protein
MVQLGQSILERVEGVCHANLRMAVLRRAGGGWQERNLVQSSLVPVSQELIYMVTLAGYAGLLGRQRKEDLSPRQAWAKA